MLLPTLLATFALLAPLADAGPVASKSIAWNAVSPRSTPTNVHPKKTRPIPLAQFSRLFGFTPKAAKTLQVSSLGARDIAELMVRGVSIDGGEGTLEERDILEKRDTPVLTTAESQTAQTAIAANCVGSSANDTYLTSLFYYGGPGVTVYLCPNAVINLTNAVFMFWANSTLATLGLPTDSTRATLRITAADQSCAIYSAFDNANNLAVRNIQIDGARPALGHLWNGIALLEMGGNNYGQTVDNVHAYEPRGWSVLHAIEGYANYCSGFIATNNQLGPAGNSPSGAQQFKRDVSYGPYEWADGVSLACKNSIVSANVITDATDGGVVIFGAPGSKITGNTIQSVNRQLLGGINMVDYWPYAGSFVGVEVTGNTIIAQSTFIKVGVAIGGMVWGTDNRTIARTFGGMVRNNVFRAGANGYFGYAIGAAGHVNVTVTGNDARTANFGSALSQWCFTAWFPLPPPQSFIADPTNTPGSIFQSGFSLSTLVFLICRAPGAILSIGGINL